MSIDTKRNKGERLDTFPERYVVIDIETTGLDPKIDHIIEMAAVRFESGNELNRFVSFVKCPVPLSDFISSLTNITDDMLIDAPPISDVINDFYEFIGDDILLGHNVHFDINFLYDALLKYKNQELSNDFIDTLQLSKRYIPTMDHHTLSDLVNHYSIDTTGAHRALADCLSTNEVYINLRDEPAKLSSEESDLLASINCDCEYNGKSIAFVGRTAYFNYDFECSLCDKLNAEYYPYFSKYADYVVFSKLKYKYFNDPEYNSKHIDKARQLAKDGVKIMCEQDFYESIGIHINTKHSEPININDIQPSTDDIDTENPFYDKVIVFTGTLEKMKRKDAMQLVVNLGAKLGNSVTKKTDYLILGNNDYCSSIKDGKSTKQKKAEDLIINGQDLTIISENVFYDMINE